MINQLGSVGEMLVKYGIIDRCTIASMTNKQSQIARLNSRKIIQIDIIVLISVYKIFDQ